VLRRLPAGVVVVAWSLVTLLATGCSLIGPHGRTATTTSSTGRALGTAAASSGTPSASASPAGYTKVLMILEENKAYDEIIGADDAPYLTALAKQYGSATAMDAGYPVSCPSLAAYIILTSGSDHDICDDKPPSAHPLTGDNLFQQLATRGRQWRVYAQSMPGTCRATDTDDSVYLVRHTAAPYYASEKARCTQWDVPLGTPTAGALRRDLSAGALPAFSLATPDACHDMHGGGECGEDMVKAGDSWLATWIPAITSSPDYIAGHLVVVITWDEGSEETNHIPTLVISPTTKHVQYSTAATHCSTLRTVSDLLGVPPLGCAAKATSMAAGFGLRVNQH
jgi:phospholipase C